jgi:hypothetical protein
MSSPENEHFPLAFSAHELRKRTYASPENDENSPRKPQTVGTFPKDSRIYLQGQKFEMFQHIAATSSTIRHEAVLISTASALLPLLKGLLHDMVSRTTPRR